MSLGIGTGIDTGSPRLSGLGNPTISDLPSKSSFETPVQLAQVGGTVTLPSGRGIALPNGNVRLPGGHIATVAQVLETLRSAAERSQVEIVVDRFNLNPNNAADLMAARAHVRATYKAPWFSDAGFSGPTLGRAAQAIMHYERAHPGTTFLADRGDPSAMRALQSIANDAVAQLAITERRSSVNPALGTTSSTARALVASGTRMQNWQAHHPIPFAEVAKLPTNVQIAIARSGWKMDSAENLVALPADAATFRGPPNNGVRPLHNSSHALYSSDVASRLSNLRTNGANMTDPQIRTELAAIEGAMRGALVNRAGPYWPVVR